MKRTAYFTMRLYFGKYAKKGKQQQADVACKYPFEDLYKYILCTIQKSASKRGSGEAILTNNQQAGN